MRVPWLYRYFQQIKRIRYKLVLRSTVSQRHKQFGTFLNWRFTHSCLGVCLYARICCLSQLKQKHFPRCISDWCEVCLMEQRDRFNGWSSASVLNCLFVSGKVTAHRNSFLWLCFCLHVAFVLPRCCWPVNSPWTLSMWKSYFVLSPLPQLWTLTRSSAGRQLTIW